MISSIGILNGYAAPVFMKYFLSLASTLENSLIFFQFIYKMDNQNLLRRLNVIIVPEELTKMYLFIAKIAPNSIIYLVLIQKVKIFHFQKNGTAINVA